MFFEVIADGTGYLVRRTLNNQDPACLLHLVGGDIVMVPSRETAKFCKGLFKCSRNIGIEVGCLCGGTKAITFCSLQCPIQDRVVQIMPAWHPPALFTEEQFLGSGGWRDHLIDRAKELLHQCWGGKHYFLSRTGGLLTIHHYQSRCQGLLGNTTGNKGKVRGLLYIRSKKGKAAAVTRLVQRLMATANG